MLPPAPTRLSTTTCWPSVADRPWAAERAMTSVLPPAAKLTTIRIGRAGQAWAAAWVTKPSPISTTQKKRIERVMCCNPPHWFQRRSHQGKSMLKSHGRYDYSAITKRPDYSWPDGKRLAVHLCLNIEHFSFGEGLGNDYSVPQPQPNVRSYAWRDYGNRVGAWRLMELADAYDLPYAILLNSALYDYCPELLAAFA